MNTPVLRHCHLQRDADGLAWLALDHAGARVNVLSEALLDDIGLALDALRAEPPTGLVIRSAKAAGFMAGADLKLLTTLSEIDAARAFAERGWALLARLAAAPYPTLALIHGDCLGGGLELALACRYRLVADAPNTALALPEVLLGIFPAWGGLKRLPACIGAPAALDMMLTGRRIDAHRAVTLGLAETRVPPRLLLQAARQTVLSRRRPRRHWLARLDGLAPWRAWVARQARRGVAAKDPEAHYLAPAAIIDLWQHHQGRAQAAPHWLARIVQSPVTHNLMRVYQLQERLKGLGRGAADVQQVHVIGAGVMGGDIAAWCALRGLRVTLQDSDPTRIAAAVQRAGALYQRRLKTPHAIQAALDRLIPDPQGAGLRHADLTIEAITEDRDAKQALYRRIESQLKPQALLATNTSSLPLADLRQALARPERLIGLHFFNPVARMPLVEVIAEGDPALQARACAIAARLGKLPLPVRDTPGFLVNALLAPYLLAAMRSVDAGLAPATIDAALKAYGMPMGPLELADTVGLDVALAAGRQLSQQGEPPACLMRHIQRGELGRKSGRGFYRWVGGRSVAQRAAPAPAGLAQQLIAPLQAQARALVQSGVVADADLADAGAIFGAGYAPYTGGPLHADPAG